MLVGLNEDLNKLWDEGYHLQIKGGYLLVHNVPYYSVDKKVKRDGILVMTLELAGDKTVNPVSDHSTYFIGNRPADHSGQDFAHTIQFEDQKLQEDLIINFRFSSVPRDRPNNKYRDFYDKVTRYVHSLMSAAYQHDETVTATGLRVPLPEEADSVFVYPDTNSSRANISQIADKLKGYKIGIIGLGGTGSYILDLISKTKVEKIHLFDGDFFCNHNAFRAPSATPIEILREHPKKVDYWKAVYSKMHLGIQSHDVYITDVNVGLLDDLDFVFLSMDANDNKKVIVQFLTDRKKPFIDVGIGLLKKDDDLFGHVITATVTEQSLENVVPRLILKSLEDDEYNHNIQIAELNALNACLAVIKWKKLFGIYMDYGQEFYSTYIIKSNKILNIDPNHFIHGHDSGDY